MSKNIGVIITIAIFLIGVVSAAGAIQAKVTAQEKALDGVQQKLTQVKEDLISAQVTNKFIDEKTKAIENKLDKILDIMTTEKAYKETTAETLEYKKKK